jgi:hypothetical protein
MEATMWMWSLPFFAQSVTDGDPPGRGLAAVLGEVHVLHEVISDGAPLGVGELAFFRGQAQGAVEDVSAIDLGLVELVCAVQGVGDVQGCVPIQFVVIVPGHERGVPGDKVRFLVFVGTSRAREVDHQARHAVALGDVRNHGRFTGRPSRRAVGQCG